MAVLVHRGHVGMHRTGIHWLIKKVFQCKQETVENVGFSAALLCLSSVYWNNAVYLLLDLNVLNTQQNLHVVKISVPTYVAAMFLHLSFLIIFVFQSLCEEI